MATETTTIRVVADTRDAERAIGGLTTALAALGGMNFVSNLGSQFITLANNAAEMTNKLIFATGSLANANQAMDILAASAQRTGSNLGGTVDLFQKLSMSSTLAGSSTQSLAYITEQFNKTLQISGASGAGAAAAQYQFAQAMQKGTLNGDEMRTMMETNGYLMKVLEEQTGKTRVELIAMASQGQLSVEMITKALVNSDQIAKDYGQTIRTLPQAVENFNTSLTVAVKKLDEKLGVTKALSAALGLLSDNIGVAIGALAGLAVGIVALTAALIPAATAMAILTGGVALLAAAGVGAAIGLAVQEANKLTEATNNTVKSQQQLAEEAKKGLKITPQRTQQELDLDKALREQIDKLKQTNQYLAQEGPLKDRNLEVEKALGAERAKYISLGKQIPKDLESQLRGQLMIQAVEKDRIATQSILLDLANAQAMATQTDAFERAVLGKMQAYQKTVSEQEYKIKKSKVEQEIRDTLTKEYSNKLTTIGLENQARAKALQDQTVDGRFAELALAEAQNQYGKEFVKNNRDLIIEQDKSRRYSEYDLELRKQLEALQQNANALTIEDIAERQFQLSLVDEIKNKGEAYVKTNEDALRNIFMTTGTQKLQAQLTDEIKNKQKAINNAMGLTTQEQKIQAELDKIRAVEGSKFTKELEEQHKTALEITALMERQLAIRTAIADLQAPPTTQEVIGAVQGQFGTTQAGIAKQRQIQEEALQALRDQGLIDEQQFQDKLLVIRQEASAKQLAEDQKLMTARLKNAGVTNQAVIDMVTQQQAQVAMIQQGGVVGAQGMLGATANIFQQLGTYNKEAFETYKALAIAQAMISTYQAAAMAIAFPPGPPLSYFYVAGAIAAGLAQVSAIKNQKFSGRALGGPMVGGQSYLVGEKGPEIFTPGTAGNMTPNNKLNSAPVSVTFNIMANDTAGFDQLLNSRKGLITQIIADAQLEKGSR